MPVWRWKRLRSLEKAQREPRCRRGAPNEQAAWHEETAVDLETSVGKDARDTLTGDTGFP